MLGTAKIKLGIIIVDDVVDLVAACMHVVV
jgi:hypothetical protein